LCPGGVCAVEPDPRVQPRLTQAVVAMVYLAAVVGVAQAVYHDAHADPIGASTATAAAQPGADAAEAERCKVPEFAKAMGHEEMWKLHNNCK
jgi:negative regulator of sigma E activity